MHATLAGHDRAVSCMGFGVMYHQAIKRFLAERAVSVNENLELIGVVIMRCNRAVFRLFDQIGLRRFFSSSALPPFAGGEPK